MALLLEEDYQILKDANLQFEEDETTRFFVFKDFPLPKGVYVSNAEALITVEVLYVIPPNYNTEGGDMFWVRPNLARKDGVPIPNVNGPGNDSRTHKGNEYLRWSRHWNQPHQKWKPKKDNIRTIIDRITWAFTYSDAKRK